MAETAGLILSVLGLLPILTGAFQSVRNTCAGILAHESTCALLLEDCSHIEASVTTAITSVAKACGQNIPEDPEYIRTVLEETKSLIKVVEDIHIQLQPFCSQSVNFFKRWLASRKAGNKILECRERLRDALGTFTAMSIVQSNLHQIDTEAAIAQDLNEIKEMISDISRLMSKQTIEIPSVFDVNLHESPRAATKAWDSLREEVSSALESTSEGDPSKSPIASNDIQFLMKLLTSTNGMPEGSTPSGSSPPNLEQQQIVDLYRRRLYFIRIRDLESRTITDDEIILKPHQTYEYLVHELLRPRGSWTNVKSDFDLFCFSAYTHEGAVAGQYWISLRHMRDCFLDYIPKTVDGWHEVGIVRGGRPFPLLMVQSQDSIFIRPLKLSNEDINHFKNPYQRLWYMSLDRISTLQWQKLDPFTVRDIRIFSDSDCFFLDRSVDSLAAQYPKQAQVVFPEYAKYHRVGGVSARAQLWPPLLTRRVFDKRPEFRPNLPRYKLGSVERPNIEIIFEDTPRRTTHQESIPCLTYMWILTEVLESKALALPFRPLVQRALVLAGQSRRIVRALNTWFMRPEGPSTQDFISAELLKLELQALQNLFDKCNRCTWYNRFLGRSVDPDTLDHWIERMFTSRYYWEPTNEQMADFRRHQEECKLYDERESQRSGKAVRRSRCQI